MRIVREARIVRIVRVGLPDCLRGVAGLFQVLDRRADFRPFRSV